MDLVKKVFVSNRNPKHRSTNVVFTLKFMSKKKKRILTITKYMDPTLVRKPVPYTSLLLLKDPQIRTSKRVQVFAIDVKRFIMLYK